MWKRHWKLVREPFDDPGTPYLSFPGHDEAVARLVQTIETGQRFAMLRAAAGLGKSRVLSRALAESRNPTRRIALVRTPGDSTLLLSGLAESLGMRVPVGDSRSAAWKALADAVRLCRWQRLQTILAIDDCQDFLKGSDRLDLERLALLDAHPDSRITVLAVLRGNSQTASGESPWSLAIRLAPLTRSEVERYLVEKLAAAGRDEATFTPRAIQRLHLITAGVPRGLDRLATLALMAGAVRGLEIIPPDLIDGVALECHGGEGADEWLAPGVVDGTRFLLR